MRAVRSYFYCEHVARAALRQTDHGEPEVPEGVQAGEEAAGAASANHQTAHDVTMDTPGNYGLPGIVGVAVSVVTFLVLLWRGPLPGTPEEDRFRSNLLVAVVMGGFAAVVTYVVTNTQR